MIGGILWRHPDFLKLWGGQTVSELGSAVTTVALPTVAYLQLHATAFDIGLLFAAQRITFPLLAPFVGVFVDRVRRRPVMIVSDVGRMLLLGSIPASALAHALTLGQLYAVALLTGVLTIFFDVAYLAYLPSLIPRETLLEGNAKFQMSLSVTQLAGPGLAGLLITALGGARAIAVDAASYLVSWVNLLFIRAPEPTATTYPQAALAGIGDGLRHIANNPVLRSMILIIGVSIFGAHAVESVEYPFAYGPLRFTPALFGLLLSLSGVGAIAGSLVAQAVTRRLGVGGTIGVTGVVSGLALGFLAAAVVLPAVPVVAIASFSLGFLDPIHNVNQLSLRQALTPDRLQGRMNAAFRTVYWGLWPLGNIVGGYLGSRIGLIPVIIGGGVWMTIGSLAVFVTPLIRIREHPTSIEEAPA